jgi:pre-mRNA-processing factor 19
VIESYAVTAVSEPLYPGSSTIAVDETGELAIVGGTDGIAGIYSLAQKQLISALKVGGSITEALWFGSRAVVSSSTGVVKVFDNGNEVVSFTSHAGAVNGLALHPCGDILASVGVDKSFVFYDLASGKAVTQVYTDSGRLSSNNDWIILTCGRTHHGRFPP